MEVFSNLWIRTCRRTMFHLHSQLTVFSSCALTYSSAYCDVAYWLWGGPMKKWTRQANTLFNAPSKLFLLETVYLSFIRLPLLISLYIKLFNSVHMCHFFLLKSIIFFTSALFPKAWPFCHKCWANFEFVMLFLNECKFSSNLISKFLPVCPMYFLAQSIKFS